MDAIVLPIMTYDPRRRGDPPGDLPRPPRDHARPPRDTGGLGTRAALGLATVLLAVGLVATAALAGSGNPGPVAGLPVASSEGLVAGPAGGGSPSPLASAGSAASQPPAASALPAASASVLPAASNPAPNPNPSPTPTPAPPGATIPSGALQAKLDAVRARLKIPGATVAILWDDGRQWLGASGLRDVRANEPMTTGTAVALASVSKTLTAAVTLQLVDEGKLGLDQPVAPLLPEYRLDKRITVRMLLDHTSGLPDYFLNVKINRPLQRAPDATWTPAQALAFVPKGHATPGRRWIYSNANYLLLGELVERVTGQPIATEIRERLLTPLGLEQTWYQAVEKPRAPGVVAYRVLAAGPGKVRYVPVARPSDVVPMRAVITAAGAAGSMAATALDAARWMRAWAGGQELSPGLQAQVLADVARTAKLRARIPYGLGIQALPVGNRPALGHSGRYLGIRNVVRYLPADGVTIAVLTNQSVADPTRIATALLKLILPSMAAPGASPSPGT
jgi:D-alanyl-D-alanine carboxypeptidase